MKFTVLSLLIILTGNIYSQQAADYFPQQLGYNWDYQLSILDSLNNPTPGMTFYRIDSLAFVDSYQNKDAYHILTKTGTLKTIQFLPFTDTNYVHLTGSDGYEYFKISELDFLLGLIDTTTLNTLLPFIGLVESFSGWHLNYRFAQNVNQQYQIFSFDTTIVIDTLVLPLRFIINGKRLQDENLETTIGTFLCKKFLITRSVNYLVTIPPFPPVPVPVVTIRDTTWVAPGNWIVQSIIPSTEVDLTLLNLGEFIIPGLKREMVSEPTSVSEESGKKFTFRLEQNYPNPFNPSTRIKFYIEKTGFVSIKVYDPLGKEITSLVDEELNAGNHEVIFNGKDLSSGVYFYALEFSDLSSGLSTEITKQMLLIK